MAHVLCQQVVELSNKGDYMNQSGACQAPKFSDIVFRSGCVQAESCGLTRTAFGKRKTSFRQSPVAGSCVSLGQNRCRLEHRYFTLKPIFLSFSLNASVKSEILFSSTTTVKFFLAREQPT